MSSFPVDALNKWQRMRLVTLALAANAKPALLLDPAAASAATDAGACACCGVRDAVEKGVHRFPFGSLGRSLVDKHFDALAQTATELGVPVFGLSAPDGGDASALELQLARGGSDPSAATATTASPGPATCLLCDLAQQSCRGLKTVEQSTHPWWWENKYDPSWVDVETGDIGGEVEPADDIIARPLAMWAENCRFVLAAAAARVAAQQKRSLAAATDDAGADSNGNAEGSSSPSSSSPAADRAAKKQAGIALLSSIASDLSSQSQWQVFRIDDDGAMAQSAPALEAHAPETHGSGFNRSRILLSSGFRAKSAGSALATPLSLSLFLCEKMLRIAQLVVQRAVATSPSSIDEAVRARLQAALFFYVFSDARRRQSNVMAQQSGGPLGALGGAGGAGGAMAMMMLAGGGGGGGAAAAAGGSSESAAALTAALSMLNAGGGVSSGAAGLMSVTLPPPSPTPAGGDNTGDDSRASAVSAMMASLQAQARAQQQQTQRGQEQQPPPPFPLPLSLLEETLVLCPTFAQQQQPELLSQYEQLLAVRSRVEIEPYLAAKKADDAEDAGDDDEAALEAAMARAAAPMPSYAGEMGDALAALCG